MAKKPVNFIVKNAKDAVSKLNDFVEQGGSNFEVGVSTETVNHLSKNSDGTTTTTQEIVFRVTGLVDMVEESELFALKEVKDDLKKTKREREAMERTFKVMNKSPFAPISVFLLCVSIFTLVLGILTTTGILPLPESQKAIAIALIIVGVLALAGSILLAVFRSKKKKSLLARKDEILKENAELKARESDVDARVPQWYKESLWSLVGNNIAMNSKQKIVFDKNSYSKKVK